VLILLVVLVAVPLLNHVYIISIILVSEETFFKIFDKVNMSQVKIGELSITYKDTKWHLKKYLVGYIKSKKIVLVDLTGLGVKELSKQLLEDLINVAGKLESEELCVAIAAKSPTTASMARNLTIFGFTADTKAQISNLTSSSSIAIMRMEVSQEDDFVDLC